MHKYAGEMVIIWDKVTKLYKTNLSLEDETLLWIPLFKFNNNKIKNKCIVFVLSDNNLIKLYTLYQSSVCQ